MYFGHNLYECQRHMVVASIKTNTELINFLLSKKRTLVDIMLDGARTKNNLVLILKMEK
jgi:hypothetical protein